MRYVLSVVRSIDGRPVQVRPQTFACPLLLDGAMRAERDGPGRIVALYVTEVPA